MSQDALQADWIAAEVDDDQLRVWPMQGDTPLTLMSCPCGPAGLTADLVSLTSSWLFGGALPVVLSGHDGAPAMPVPCKPLDLDPGADIAGVKRFTLHPLPGLHQTSPSAVMHAATVRIAGFLSLNPTWDGVLCLPGRHTHWAQISAGEVVSFQSFATLALQRALGELPDLAEAFDDCDWDRDAFGDAVSDTLSRPERLAARIAELQADIQLNSPDAAIIRGRLSGLLIGAELSAARPYWLGQAIALVGEDHNSAPYAHALGQQGLGVTITDSQRMTLAGLTAGYKRLKGN